MLSIPDFSFLQILNNCPKLQHLDLSYCLKVQEPPQTNVLLHLTDTLQKLSLCGVYMTDSDLLVQAVVRLTRIREIRLCGVPALDDTSLEKVQSY